MVHFRPRCDRYGLLPMALAIAEPEALAVPTLRSRDFAAVEAVKYSRQILGWNAIAASATSTTILIASAATPVNPGPCHVAACCGILYEVGDHALHLKLVDRRPRRSCSGGKVVERDARFWPTSEREASTVSSGRTHEHQSNRSSLIVPLSSRDSSNMWSMSRSR